jgi:hypothetical protein
MDKSYWELELPHPLCPDRTDVEIYMMLLGNRGRTMMLGCSRALLPFSDVQLDIDPWLQAPSVQVGDWRFNQTEYDTIVGDGCFNFSKDLTDSVLEMASRFSSRLVVRCFSRRLPQMKVANYFPLVRDFKISPELDGPKTDYNFFRWKFR